MNSQELAAAATAYRAACNGAGDKLEAFGHLDCVVDWNKQQVRVTGESRTVAVDMGNEAFNDEVRRIGRMHR
jgi:hypothetical protein